MAEESGSHSPTMLPCSVQHEEACAVVSGAATCMCHATSCCQRLNGLEESGCHPSEKGKSRLQCTMCCPDAFLCVPSDHISSVCAPMHHAGFSNLMSLVT